jgi:hypothetical protein
MPPDPPPPPALACEVRVTDGSLAFELVNTTAAARTVAYHRPYMGFELKVTDQAGNPRSLEQPAIDMPVERADLVVPARGKATLSTPIRLRFAGDGAPPDSSRFTWVISGERAPVTLDVRMRLDGDKTVLTCRGAL